MNESYLISKRRWFKKPGAVNPINPSLDTASTLVGSPSPVKSLFPSLSMFNIPTNTTNTQPPPQFAVDPFKRDKILLKLKPKSKIEKGYPSALETYLFDDVVPGSSGQGIRPVRLLIERLEAWYLLSKRLLYHFELFASIESQVSKSYRQLDTAIIFPSPHHMSSKYHHHRHRTVKKVFYKQQHKGERLLQVHFSFNTGIKSICDAWQKYHVDTTSDHAACATFLRNEAIPTLRNIKHELKSMIRSIQQDDRLSLSTLTKFKREAARRLKKLDRQLIFFDEHPYHSYSKKDPWLMNADVVTQMAKVYSQENKIHETVLRLQREILVSEDQIVLELKQVCQQIYQLYESSNLGLDKGIQHIMTSMDNVQSDWQKFYQDHQHHLVSENAAFRHPDHLQYPNHTHSLLQPIFAARMERKFKFSRKWKESIYVLTEAGFLHEYMNPHTYPAHPTASIFIPHFKVSSVSTHLHHDLVFEIQPHKASRINMKSPNKQWHSTTPRLGYQDRWTWKLRAKSAYDMDLWIKHLTHCSERYRQPCFIPDIIVTKEEEPEETPVESTEEKSEEQAEELPSAEENPPEETVSEQETTETSSEEAATEEAATEEAATEEAAACNEEEPKEETVTEDEVKPEEEPIKEGDAEEKVENAVF